MNGATSHGERLALAKDFIGREPQPRPKKKSSPPYQHRDKLESEFAKHVAACYGRFKDNCTQRTANPIFVVHGLPGMGKTRFGEEALTILHSQVDAYPKLSKCLKRSHQIKLDFNGGDAMCDFDKSLSPEESMAARLFCRLFLQRRLDRVVRGSPEHAAVLRHLVKSGCHTGEVLETFALCNPGSMLAIQIDEAQLPKPKIMRAMLRELMVFQGDGDTSRAVEAKLFVVLIATCLGGDRFITMHNQLFDAGSAWQGSIHRISPLTVLQLYQILKGMDAQAFGDNFMIRQCLALLGGCPRLAIESLDMVRTQLDPKRTASPQFVQDFAKEWQTAILAQADAKMTRGVAQTLMPDAIDDILLFCLTGVPVHAELCFNSRPRGTITIAELETSGTLECDDQRCIKLPGAFLYNLAHSAEVRAIAPHFNRLFTVLLGDNIGRLFERSLGHYLQLRLLAFRCRAQLTTKLTTLLASPLMSACLQVEVMEQPILLSNVSCFPEDDTEQYTLESTQPTPMVPNKVYLASAGNQGTDGRLLLQLQSGATLCVHFQAKAAGTDDTVSRKRLSKWISHAEACVQTYATALSKQQASLTSTAIAGQTVALEHVIVIMTTMRFVGNVAKMQAYLDKRAMPVIVMAQESLREQFPFLYEWMANFEATGTKPSRA